MNWLAEFASYRMVTALGWTILHSIWICASMVALLMLLLAGFRKASAATRYAICCAALLSMMLLLGVTLLHEIRTTPSVESLFESVKTTSIIGSNTTQVDGEGTTPISAFRVSNRLTESPDLNLLLPWIVMVWALGTIVLSARLLGGWLRMRRLQGHATKSPDWCDECVGRLADKLQLPRSIRLLICEAIDVPCVIGWLKPIMLMPPAMLSGMPIDQVEMILAHELAHIARQDYLVNVLLAVTETLLFYHPAVWWLARRMRVDRENCCDDIAVAVCGDRVGYARALLALESARIGPARLALALNATGLLPRIRRLAGQSRTNTTLSRWPAGVIVVVSLGLIALVIGCSHGSPQPTTKLAATQPTARAVDIQPAPSQDVYTLADNEVAKFIPSSITVHRSEVLDDVGSMTDGGQAVLWWTDEGAVKLYAYTRTVRPYSFTKAIGTVGSALSAAGLEHWEVEPVVKGDHSLLWKSVDGDWLIRRSAPRDQRLNAVVKILASQVPGFRVTPTVVDRDVLIAKGSFRVEDHPEIYVSSKNPMGQSGGGSGSLQRLLQRIGEIAGLRVLDETDSTLGTVVWKEDISVGLFDQNGRRMVSPMEVIEQFQEDTGLKLVPAKTPQVIYFVSATR